MMSLASCYPQDSNKSEEVETTRNNEMKIDSVDLVIKSKPHGITLFIDSMKAVNYLLDTNRIKQTLWSVIVKHPTTIVNGHPIIQLSFPVDDYSKHFTNPKTYYFAYWNDKLKTFKNGDDYLLMTWTIDREGVRNEKEIFAALHEFMGNFPCYIFRSEKTVYALSHRMTAAATKTGQLTEQLRNFIDANAIIYRPFGRNVP